MMSAIKKLGYELSSRSRRIKLDLFWSLFSPVPGTTVLNLGAAPPHLGRELLGSGVEERFEQPEQDSRWQSLSITAGNLNSGDMKVYDQLYRKRGFSALVLDAQRLPFHDKSVDIVFSNAVIEHLTPAGQQLMAREIMRVGRSWFVTTPNFWYPIELHNKVPLFQFFPRSLQRLIQKRFNTWPVSDPIHLLSAAQLLKLLPGSKIRKVRVTFLAETLIAYFVGPVPPNHA